MYERNSRNRMNRAPTTDLQNIFLRILGRGVKDWLSCHAACEAHTGILIISLASKIKPFSPSFTLRLHDYFSKTQKHL